MISLRIHPETGQQVIVRRVGLTWMGFDPVTKRLECVFTKRPSASALGEKRGNGD